MRVQDSKRSITRLALTAAFALALAGAPPTARAEDAPDNGSDPTTEWSTRKFFDYTACAVGIVATVETGGLAWWPTAVVCTNALVTHMSD